MWRDRERLEIRTQYAGCAMKAYRIVEWDTLYENNRTREMKIMAWVPVPIKHDGYGYGLLTVTNGAARLGAWLAILQTAAKSHPRGTLLRDGRHPHTAESIAVKTRLEPSIIKETIEACLHPDIGWIEVVDIQGDTIIKTEIPHPPAEIPHPPARKGREGNRPEKKETAIALPCFDSVEFLQSWNDWIEHRREIKKPLTPKASQAQMRCFSEWGESRSIAAINHTISKGWQGIREPDTASNKQTQLQFRNKI
jgi:hypothetical protein